MKDQDRSVYKAGLWQIASVVYILSSLILAMPSLAQVTFNPPKNQAPRNSTGGASRDTSTCGADLTATTKASVTPLLPKTNIGLTAAEHPTVFVYVPPTNAKKALFILQDAQGKQHYQTTLSLSNKQGVMEVKLPDSVSVLKTDQDYQWSLVMICTEELEPDSPFVSGWIRRVESKNMTKKPPSLELASNLANQGLWYDLLATLAELKRTQPNNPTVASSWKELLNSVELNEIAEAPLVN